MRVTFLTRSLNYGGAERQLVNLATGLHQLGYKIAVIVFYSNGPLETRLRDAGVTVRSLNKAGRWHAFGFLLQLIKLIREERPEILHSYLGFPNILAALLSPFFPRMHVIWGVRASNVDLARYDWLARFLYRVECRLSRFTNLIIVNSHAGREHAAKHGFPIDRMVVIPNGIDVDRFRPNPSQRRQVRAEWGVSDSDKLIGIVGRLDPMKDYPTFLKAAALLSGEQPNVRFVCVGDGPESYLNQLRALCRELGLADRLIWAGQRSDAPAVYNAIDLLVSSSSYGEGFPNVIGEAMACGVPCVTTDVGDSAWIVGDLSEVISPNDPEMLKSAINNLLQRIAASDHDISPYRRRIVDSFSSDELIRKTDAVLLRLYRGLDVA